MAQRLGGFRRKSRHKFTKSRRTKGKVGFSKYFASFSQGDQVYLGVEPAVQEGMYNPKYLGKSGIVQAKRGRCFEVLVNDLGKSKTLIVHPVHLKRSA